MKKLLVLWISLALTGCPDDVDDDDTAGDDDDTVQLSAPIDLTGFVTDDGYRLRWTDTNDQETGYLLEAKDDGAADYTVIAELGADSVEHVDSAHSAALARQYRLCAIADDQISDPALLDSTIPHWAYIRIIVYDEYWGDSGPTMDELIAGHLTYDMATDGGANENLNLVLLGDALTPQGSIYAAVAPGGDVEITEQDELNMGDVQNYRDFMDWVLANHPGQRYVVSFWSHGGGSALKDDKSIGYDHTDHDELDPDETGEMLAYLAEQSGRRVDIFSVCACVTQMVENAYPLRDHVRYMVAGETNVGCGCDVLDVLRPHADWTTTEIANATTDEHHVTQWTNDVIFSTVDLSQVDELVAQLDELATALQDYTGQSQANFDEVTGLAAETLNMTCSGGPTYTHLYLDLGDFCDRLSGMSDMNIATLADQIGTLMRDEVITNLMVQSDNEGCFLEGQGLSILHSNPDYQYYYYFQDFYEGLSFAQDTGWDEYQASLGM